MGNHQSRGPLINEHHSLQRERRRSAPLSTEGQIPTQVEHQLVQHRTSNGSSHSSDSCQTQGVSTCPDQPSDRPSAIPRKASRSKRSHRISSRESSAVPQCSQNEFRSIETPVNDDEALDDGHPALTTECNQSLSGAKQPNSSVESAICLQEHTRHLVVSASSDSVAGPRLQLQQCCVGGITITDNVVSASSHQNSINTSNVSSLYEFLGIAPDYLDRALSLDISFDFEANECLPSQLSPDSSSRPGYIGGWSDAPPLLVNSYSISKGSTAITFCPSLEDIIGESLSDSEELEESRTQPPSLLNQHALSTKVAHHEKADSRCQSLSLSISNSSSSSRPRMSASTDRAHSPESLGIDSSSTDHRPTSISRGMSTAVDEPDAPVRSDLGEAPGDMEAGRLDLPTTDVLASDPRDSTTYSEGIINIDETSCMTADATSVCLVKACKDMIVEDINSNKIALVPESHNISARSQGTATRGGLDTDGHHNTDEPWKDLGWASQGISNEQTETVLQAECSVGEAGTRCKNDAYRLGDDFAPEPGQSTELPTEFFSMVGARAAVRTCLPATYVAAGSDSAFMRDTSSEQAVSIAGDLREDWCDNQANDETSIVKEMSADAGESVMQTEQHLAATTSKLQAGAAMSAMTAQRTLTDEGLEDAVEIESGSNSINDHRSVHTQPAGSCAASISGTSQTDCDAQPEDTSSCNGGPQSNEQRPNCVVGIQASFKQPQQLPGQQIPSSSAYGANGREATTDASAAVAVAAAAATTTAAVTVTLQASEHSMPTTVLAQGGIEREQSHQPETATASGNSEVSPAAITATAATAVRPAPMSTTVPVLRIRRAIVVQTGGTTFQSTSSGSGPASNNQSQAMQPLSARGGASPWQVMSGSSAGGSVHSLTASAPTTMFRQWRKSDDSATTVPKHNVVVSMAAPSVDVGAQAGSAGESLKTTAGIGDDSARTQQLDTIGQAETDTASCTITSLPDDEAPNTHRATPIVTTAAASTAAARPPSLSLSPVAVVTTPQTTRLRLGAQPFMRSNSLPAFKPLGKLFTPSSPLSPGFQKVPAKIDEQAEIATSVSSITVNSSSSCGGVGHDSTDEQQVLLLQQEAGPLPLAAVPASEEAVNGRCALTEEPVAPASTVGIAEATAAAVAAAEQTGRDGSQCCEDATPSSSASSTPSKHEELATMTATTAEQPATSLSLMSITLRMNNVSDSDNAPSVRNEPAADGEHCHEPDAQQHGDRPASLLSTWHGYMLEANTAEAAWKNSSPAPMKQSSKHVTPDHHRSSHSGSSSSSSSSSNDGGVGAEMPTRNGSGARPASDGDRSYNEGMDTAGAAATKFAEPNPQRDATRQAKSASWSIARSDYDDDHDGSGNDSAFDEYNQQQQPWSPSGTTLPTDRDVEGEKPKLQGVEKERLDVINSMKVRRKTIDLKQDARTAAAEEASSNASTGVDSRHTIPNRIRRLSLDGRKNSATVRSQPASVVLRKPVSDMVKTLQSSAGGDS